MQLDSLSGLITKFDINNYSLLIKAAQLFLSVLFGLAISFLYSKVNHDEGKNKREFICSLILLPIVTTAITLVIGNSIVRAFGLIGAVSIVRFRTSIKSPSDMAFVFLSITLGIACGCFFFLIGAAALIIFGITVLIIDKLKSGKRRKEKKNYLLIIQSEDPAFFEKVKRNLEDIILSFKLQEAGIGDKISYKYRIELAENISEIEMVKRLSAISMSGKGELKLTKNE